MTRRGRPPRSPVWGQQRTGRGRPHAGEAKSEPWGRWPPLVAGLADQENVPRGTGHAGGAPRRGHRGREAGGGRRRPTSTADANEQIWARRSRQPPAAASNLALLRAPRSSTRVNGVDGLATDQASGGDRTCAPACGLAVSVPLPTAGALHASPPPPPQQRVVNSRRGGTTPSTTRGGRRATAARHSPPPILPPRIGRAKPPSDRGARPVTPAVLTSNKSINQWDAHSNLTGRPPWRRPPARLPPLTHPIPPHFFTFPKHRRRCAAGRSGCGLCPGRRLH